MSTVKSTVKGKSIIEKMGVSKASVGKRTKSIYPEYKNTQSGILRQLYMGKVENDHCIYGCDDYCLESLVDTEEHTKIFNKNKKIFEKLKGKLCNIPPNHTIDELSQEINLDYPDKNEIDIIPYNFPEFPHVNLAGDCELPTEKYLYAINNKGIIKYSLDRKIDDENTQLTPCVGLYAYKLDIEPKLYPESIVHSCIFSGNNVIAAGEIFIVDNKIVSINNESGHYRPNIDIINLTKEVLINKYNYNPEHGHSGLLSITEAKPSPGGGNLHHFAFPMLQLPTNSATINQHHLPHSKPPTMLWFRLKPELKAFQMRKGVIKNTKKIKKNIVTMKLRNKINKRNKRNSKRNKK